MMVLFGLNLIWPGEPLARNSVRYCEKHLTAARLRMTPSKGKPGDIGWLYAETEESTHGRQAMQRERRTRALLAEIGIPPESAAVTLKVSFAGHGKLSWMMGALSMGYALLLPVYLLVAVFYNFFLRPKKKRDWESRFTCQKCGFLLNAEELPATRYRQSVA